MAAVPTLEIVAFVEQQILPRYAAFDRAHSLDHVNQVIRRSLSLARQVGADLDMAYVVAAYHDLGLSGPRAVHHLTGGKILRSDVRLRRWFSAEQIRIMGEAVEDHRASSAHEPRTVYGRIVADADRDLRPQTVFARTIQYGLTHYAEMDREAQWQRFLEHMHHKYAETGYVRLWLSTPENQQELKTLRDIIHDELRLRQEFERIFDSLQTDR